MGPSFEGGFFMVLLWVSEDSEFGAILGNHTIYFELEDAGGGRLKKTAATIILMIPSIETIYTSYLLLLDRNWGGPFLVS